MDRVFRFSRFIAAWSKAYEVGTVRTKAFLICREAKKGSARLGVLGVGVKAVVLNRDKPGPTQTQTQARQKRNAEKVESPEGKGGTPAQQHSH